MGEAPGREEPADLQVGVDPLVDPPEQLQEQAIEGDGAIALPLLEEPRLRRGAGWAEGGRGPGPDRTPLARECPAFGDRAEQGGVEGRLAEGV